MDSYRVEVTDQVRQEIRLLPGNMRQRVLRALQELKHTPRPHRSQPLDLARLGIILPPDAELRRMRMDKWRVVYLLEEDTRLVSILAIRKRPPYQYDDLDELIQDAL